MKIQSFAHKHSHTFKPTSNTTSLILHSDLQTYLFLLDTHIMRYTQSQGEHFSHFCCCCCCWWCFSITYCFSLIFVSAACAHVHSLSYSVHFFSRLLLIRWAVLSFWLTGCAVGMLFIVHTMLKNSLTIFTISVAFRLFRANKAFSIAHCATPPYTFV